MATVTKTFRPATVNEKLVDKFIRHAVAIARLQEGEAGTVATHLNREVFPAVFDKLMAKLSKVPLDQKRYALVRLRDTIVAMDKMITVGAVRAGEASASRLAELAKWEANWTSETIVKTVPLDITMNMPSTALLEAIATTKPMQGKKLQTWFKSYSKSAKRDIAKAVRVGISSGESVSDIGKRIRKAIRISSKRAGFIARTAVSNTVNHARDTVYARNKDIISSVQFVATLDARTTLVCINLDGQVFKIGDGPRPPVHFNCRSTTVPVIKAWNELGIAPPPPGTRASMNGAVPDKVTYKDWLKSQPAHIQDKVLGKARGKLYRQGADLGTFVSKDLKPIPLSRLAAETPEARGDILPFEFGDIKLQEISTIEEFNAFAGDFDPIIKTWDIDRQIRWQEQKQMVDAFGLDNASVMIARDKEGMVAGFFRMDRTKGGWTIEAVAAQPGNGRDMLRCLYPRAIATRSPIYVSPAEGVEGFYKKCGFRVIEERAEGILMKVNAAAMRKQIGAPAGSRMEKEIEALLGRPIEKKRVTKKAGKTVKMTAEEYRKDFLKRAGADKIIDKGLLEKLRGEREYWMARENGLSIELYHFENLSITQRAQLKSQRSLASNEVMRLNSLIKAELDKEKINVNKARALLFEPKNYGGKVRAVAGKYPMDDLLKMIPEGRLSAQELAEISNVRVFADQRDGGFYSNRFIHFYQSRNYHEVHVPRGYVAASLEAHEFGHHLSYCINGWFEKQNQFFTKRTIGEKMQRLPGYGSIRGKVDKFSNYSVYAGRYYPRSGMHQFPEVSSVGCEYIWKDPIHAAKADPEWFNFIIGQLKGLEH